LHTSHSPTFTLFPYTTLFRSAHVKVEPRPDFLHLNLSLSLNLPITLRTFQYPAIVQPVLVPALPGSSRHPVVLCPHGGGTVPLRDRKSTRLNSSHGSISYAVF